MFKFTKQQLEASVASLLEGTPLQPAVVSMGATGLLFVEVHLPVGFGFVDAELYKEHGRSWPSIGTFGRFLVVAERVGHSGYVFQFSPWLDQEDEDYEHEWNALVELVAMFRIPI